MSNNQNHTQAMLAAEAMRQLAIIGGALTREDDMTYKGTSWNVPAKYNGQLVKGAKDLYDYAVSLDQITTLERTFQYMPHDGAYATYQLLKEYFGYVQPTRRGGAEVDVSIGFVGEGAERKEQHVTVPFGAVLVLPQLPDGTIQIGQKRTLNGMLSHLTVRCRQADVDAVKGLFEKIDEYLRDHSIYRGKAFNGGMQFIDTDKINPDLFVYSEQVWSEAETFIFSVMRDVDLLRAQGFMPKRAVILAGDYGGGKTGLGRTAVKIAVANGWTAIPCRPGQDDPFEMIKLARLYQPCFVFIEDIDTMGQSRDPEFVSKMLDMMDGSEAKDIAMLLVLTTNHAEIIHKGMFRPGRLDTMIEIGPMDRAGVEKLAGIVCGDALLPGIDFDAVYAATEGYMPAFVREGLERSVRFSIARHRAVSKIDTDDLVRGLNSLRPQFRMQQAANDRRVELPPLDQMFRSMIEEHSANVDVEIDYSEVRDAVDSVIEDRVNGATIFRNNEEFGSISTS